MELTWTLIQRSPAVLRPTQTGDLLVLDGEFVVVGDLLVDVNGLPGVDHNLLLRFHSDDLCVTIGIAAVVDEAGEVATLGSIYDGVVVDAEHVAAPDAFLLVALLPHVRNHLSDVLSHVLDHHLISSDGLQSKQTPVVDA